MNNTYTATVTDRNFCDIKRHSCIEFSPLIDALLNVIEYQMNIFLFRFLDCIVKIASSNWKKSLNDYVKKNLLAKEQLDRNHGGQNNLERGRLIFVADCKNGSNH